MGNYQNGLESRKAILETAAKLFYEQGLNKTTYADISKAANVRIGTISYHFGNTLTIASKIGNEELGAIFENLKHLYGTEYSDFVLYSTTYLIYLIVFFKDPRYRKFHVELEAATLHKNLTSDLEENQMSYADYSNQFYREKYRELNPDGDPIQEELYFSVFPGLSNSLNFFMINNLEKISPEQAFRYSLSLYFQIFKFENEEFERILADCMAIRDQLLIGNDGFHVFIQKKS